MTNEQTRKPWLIVVRHSPYGDSRARAGLDTALATAVFDQPVSVLFLGDAVLQLLPAQEAGDAGLKSFGKQLASLPMYDIEQVFADGVALARHGVDPATAPLPVKAVDTAAIADMLASSDIVLGF